MLWCWKLSASGKLICEGGFQDATAAFEAELCRLAQDLNKSASGQARYGIRLLSCSTDIFMMCTSTEGTMVGQCGERGGTSLLHCAASFCRHTGPLWKAQHLLPGG